MNEDQNDKLISETAKKLPRHDPPDQLWDMIETKLEAIKAYRPFWQRIIDFVAGLSLPKWQLTLRYAAVTTGIALIFLMFWLKFIHESDPIKAIERAEVKYIQAIEELEKKVEKQQPDLNMNLWILYQERLSLLDESIEACKHTIQYNAENVNARKYLLLAYQEKVETLKKLLKG